MNYNHNNDHYCYQHVRHSKAGKVSLFHLSLPVSSINSHYAIWIWWQIFKWPPAEESDCISEHRRHTHSYQACQIFILKTCHTTFWHIKACQMSYSLLEWMDPTQHLKFRACNSFWKCGSGIDSLHPNQHLFSTSHIDVRRNALTLTSTLMNGSTEWETNGNKWTLLVFIKGNGSKSTCLTCTNSCPETAVFKTS